MQVNPVLADSLDAEIHNLEQFSTVYQLIRHEYVVNKDSNELIGSAIEGMVKRLDPYSTVLSAEELKNLELQSVGKYVGIGVTINQKDGRYIITQVYKGSPADQAGLVPGDEIYKIDDIVLADINYQELRDLLQGDIGSQIQISFRVPGDNRTVQEVSLKRVLVKANSVECIRHSPDIVVFAIHQFMKHTARELKSCVNKSPSSAVILDLRSNPGGLLISAVEVAELFLDIGEIVQIRDRENRVIERYVARESQPDDQPILYVLINSYSASASEILAGAIRDRGSGILIGEKSFGKGVVQSVFPVGGDLYIKITTAHYYTPSDIKFDGVGIKPDVAVSDDLSAIRYSKKDRIFGKAIELAEKKLSAK